MKVKVISDLHLECCDYGHGIPDAGAGNILVLGGDILCARHYKRQGPFLEIYNNFLGKCIENFDHVLYVAGNHEAYGYTYEKTWDTLKECLPSSIHLLENNSVKINDWIFIGATLWADFRNENPLVMGEAAQYMNDYSSIRIGNNYRKLKPTDTLNFHKQSKDFFAKEIKKHKHSKIWMVTHHGPSYQSVHKKYNNLSINGAYVSDLDDFILGHPQIKYWSHGHTHESFDYKIGDCRVVCNPRGYYNGCNSSGLNPNFSTNLEIILDD